MKSRLHSASITFLLLFILSGTNLALAFHPGSRDYLTPKEEEQVKEAQIIDKRIEVFIKAIERRLQVLTGQSAPPGKQAQKEADKWGELPKGTRVELITDIANILDAAITNIDDVALRDEKNPLIPKALRKLADATTRFQTQLTPMSAQAKDEPERIALELVMQNAEEILEAAHKLPPEEKKK